MNEKELRELRFRIVYELLSKDPKLFDMVKVAVY